MDELEPIMPPGGDDAPEEAPDGEAQEEPLSVWPPRIENPPPLPYASDSGLSLDLAERASVPEEPDFAPASLEESSYSSDAAEAARPGFVPLAPKAPGVRTRGDAILRSTSADVEARVRRKRRDAALYGATLVFFLSIFISDLSLLRRALFVLLGGGVGWLSFELGDSEWSWSAGMFLAAVACTWNMTPLHTTIYGGFFVVAGFIAGLTRDASLTA